MSTGQKNDSAVVFVCDQNHLRFALFVIWQISHHNPDRRFDFVIYSPDEITLPDWAAAWNVLVHRAKPLTDLPSFALFNGSAIPMYRFGMVRALGARYRRILYLDSDLFIEGGDFDRLLAIDLRGRSVGGALDVMFLKNLNFHMRDFRLAGLPALPYMNAGVQLIDTQGYLDQEIERRAFAAIKEHPKAIWLSDQSALNLALRGDFAELPPCWNWVGSVAQPLTSLRYPVFVRHFIYKDKPNLESEGRLEARFNLAYRDFFARRDPEFLARIALPCDPRPMALGDAARMVWRHFLQSDNIRRLLARHPDPYAAHTPSTGSSAKDRQVSDAAP